MRVIGIDPGLTPGVCVLDVVGGQLVEANVLQCSAGLLLDVVRSLSSPLSLIAVERFVTRGRANAAQSVTRDQVGSLLALDTQRHVTVVQRSAAMVKPWATDERLAAAGLLELCTGMRHARDACRHALFAAVQDGLPDPLSRGWQR